MATSSSFTGPQQQEELWQAFDGIVPPSVGTSSSTLAKQPWDVFINHRGPDVKHTLATAIYNALNRMGLRIFLDVEALQPGDLIPMHIQEAMRSASLHIAIFSKSYAHSPWCLAELSFMLKTGTRIVPVFYYVDPSDLRWVGQGKGIYSPAFSQYEQKGRYTSEKLEEWKMALQNISFHSGFVVNNDKYMFPQQPYTSSILNYYLILV